MGRVIALAMVLNPVIYERYGSVSRLVFSLPLLRIVAQRWARLRRFFDLDQHRPDAPPDRQSGPI